MASKKKRSSGLTDKQERQKKAIERDQVRSGKSREEARSIAFATVKSRARKKR